MAQSDFPYAWGTGSVLSNPAGLQNIQDLTPKVAEHKYLVVTIFIRRLHSYNNIKNC